MIDDNFYVHLRWIIDQSILAGGGQGVDDHLLQAALLSDNLETFPGYEHCPPWLLRLLSLVQNTQVYRLIKCQLSCLSMQQVGGLICMFGCTCTVKNTIRDGGSTAPLMRLK